MLVALALSYCPLLTPVIAVERELVFAPKKDSSLRKRFEETSKWRLVELTQVVNGTPIAIDGAEMSGTTSRRVTVLDVYMELGDSDPKRLRRTFEELAGEQSFDFDVQGASDSFEMSLTSPLSGVKIEFERGDDDGQAKARFAENSSGDASLLEDLTEDMDLRAFVPEDDVGVEDWWDVDADALARVLAPGGVRFALSEGGLPSSDVLDPLELASTLLCVLSENTGELAGDVTATWTETAKGEHGDTATGELDWKAQSDTKLDDRLAEILRSSGASTKRTKPTMSLTVTCEGEGALMWDLAAKHARSFDLALKTEFSAELFWNEGAGPVGYRFRFEGDSKLKAEFETP